MEAREKEVNNLNELRLQTLTKLYNSRDEQLKQTHSDLKRVLDQNR